MPQVSLVGSSSDLVADCICPLEQPTLEDTEHLPGFWLAKDDAIQLIRIDEKTNTKLIPDPTLKVSFSRGSSYEG